MLLRAFLQSRLSPRLCSLESHLSSYKFFRECWCLTSSGFQECEGCFKDTVAISSRAGLSLSMQRWEPLHSDLFEKYQIQVKAQVLLNTFQLNNVMVQYIQIHTPQPQVPILKFFDRAGGLEVILIDQIRHQHNLFTQVDLSVNNPTSIRNTHLLFCYSQVGKRFADLWWTLTCSCDLACFTCVIELSKEYNSGWLQGETSSPSSEEVNIWCLAIENNRPLL